LEVLKGPMATRTMATPTEKGCDGTRGAGFARLAELHSALADEYAAMAQRESAPTVEPHGPELLRIREACQRMSWRYSWAVKHWRRLGGFKDADGGLKISASALARHAVPSSTGP
jgi:hypothetical protein